MVHVRSHVVQMIIHGATEPQKTYTIVTRWILARAVAHADDLQHELE